jgi:hypothetical protein
MAATMEERGVAVGLGKKGGGRKKGLGFCTIQANHRWLVAGTGGDGWRHRAVMRHITASSNGHYGHQL